MVRMFSAFFVALFLDLFVYLQVLQARIYAYSVTIRSTSDIRSNILSTAGPLVGVAITLVIVAIIAGMSIIGAQDSANLASGANQLSQFLTLIGVAVALGIVVKLLKGL